MNESNHSVDDSTAQDNETKTSDKCSDKKTHNKHLVERGFQQPTHRSNVTVPSGWHDGSVENIGGGEYARIWRTWKAWTGDECNYPEYRVLYDLYDNRVTLEKYTTPDGETQQRETIRSEEAKQATDHELSLVARDLMEYANDELRPEAHTQPVYKDENATLIKKMQQDAKYVQENYGCKLAVENEFSNPKMLPYLYVHSPHRDILDEIIDVVVDRGYKVAYVDLEDRFVAFRLNPIELSEELQTHIDELLATVDITPNGEISAIPRETGFQVSVPFEGELLHNEIKDSNQGSLLGIRNDVTVEYEGIRDGEILLDVTLPKER